MGVWYKGHDEILDAKYSIPTVSNTLLEVRSLCEKALDMVKKKLVLHSVLTFWNNVHADSKEDPQVGSLS